MTDEASDPSAEESPPSLEGGGVPEPQGESAVAGSGVLAHSASDTSTAEAELTVGDDLSPPFRKATDPDSVRARLAEYLFYLFAATIAVGTLLIAFLDDSAANRVADWLTRLLPAELGVLGSAVGFYFGSKH